MQVLINRTTYNTYTCGVGVDVVVVFGGNGGGGIGAPKRLTMKYMRENTELPIASQNAAHTASSIRLWPVLLILLIGIGDPLKAQPMAHVSKKSTHETIIIFNVKSWTNDIRSKVFLPKR